MQFSIEVFNLTRETKPTAKGGSYVLLDVAFKNLTSGKTEGKKLFPFGDSEKAYKILNDAKTGSQFTITAEKGAPNAQGQSFWNWVEVAPIAPGAVTSASSKAATAPKSTYETPEERARRQVLIVKQSSLSAAVALLTIGAKTPPNLESVTGLAQKLTDWVLTDKVESLMEMQNDLTFDDVEVL